MTVFNIESCLPIFSLILSFLINENIAEQFTHHEGNQLIIVTDVNKSYNGTFSTWIWESFSMTKINNFSPNAMQRYSW